MEEFEADDDVTLLARLIWGEARGERLAGKLAVARTVLNRLPPIGQSRWWGNTVREVMLWPAQYSCFNDEHLRRGLMRGSVLEPLAWRDCVDAAPLVLSGYVRDFIGGATHYYAPARVAEPPAWAVEKRAAAEICGHLFFAGIE